MSILKKQPSIKSFLFRNCVNSIVFLIFLISIFIYNTAATYIVQTFKNNSQDMLNTISSLLNNELLKIESANYLSQYYVIIKDGIIIDSNTENPILQSTALREIPKLNKNKYLDNKKKIYSCFYYEESIIKKNNHIFFLLIRRQKTKDSFLVSFLYLNELYIRLLQDLNFNFTSTENFIAKDETGNIFTIFSSLKKRKEYKTIDFSSKLRNSHTIVLSQTYSEVSKKLLNLKLSIAAMLIFYIIFLYLKSMIMYYRLYKPIKRLTDLMDYIGEKHLEIKLQDNSYHEIEILSSQIDFMISRIKSLLNEVNNKNIVNMKSELQTLQLQINPHFLFNTLNKMKLLAVRKESTEVIEMINILSVLLHYSVYKPMTSVKISEEIIHLKSYIEIMEKRYSKIINLKITFPENLKDLKCPKLILQPIVENSISHGLKGNKSDLILIDISKNIDFIVISISDNGKGMPESRLNEVRKMIESNNVERKESIGLSNTNNRIKIKYGCIYGIIINSTEGEGTEIKIRIPDNI